MSCAHPCAHKNAERVVVTEANSAAVDANDAWRAGANHFQTYADPQAKFFEPADLFRRTKQLPNIGDLAAIQGSEWHQIGHGIPPLKQIENESQ
jgi:hypothetical protein